MKNKKRSKFDKWFDDPKSLTFKIVSGILFAVFLGGIVVITIVRDHKVLFVEESISTGELTVKNYKGEIVDPANLGTETYEKYYVK